MLIGQSVWRKGEQLMPDAYELLVYSIITQYNNVTICSVDKTHFVFLLKSRDEAICRCILVLKMDVIA